MFRSADLATKKGDHFGNVPIIKSITPRAADKIDEQVLRWAGRSATQAGRKGCGASVVAAWRVVHRLYPDCFDPAAPNPRDGVTMAAAGPRRPKPAVTRRRSSIRLGGAIEAGDPKAGAAAALASSLLQRPENVLAGDPAWPDYRGKNAPNGHPDQLITRPAPSYASPGGND